MKLLGKVLLTTLVIMFLMYFIGYTKNGYLVIYETINSFIIRFVIVFVSVLSAVGLATLIKIFKTAKNINGDIDEIKNKLTESHKFSEIGDDVDIDDFLKEVKTFLDSSNISIKTKIETMTKVKREMIIKDVIYDSNKEPLKITLIPLFNHKKILLKELGLKKFEESKDIVEAIKAEGYYLFNNIDIVKIDGDGFVYFKNKENNVLTEIKTDKGDNNNDTD